MTMYKCFRCGHDLIIGGNHMLSEVMCDDTMTEDEDAMVTNATCPHCGAYYELYDTPEADKGCYPYWKEGEGAVNNC